jgi:hypothetical protein
MDSLEDQARVEAVAVLSQFRRGFYDSLTRRADALFELTDAVLCADGPVTSLPELSLAPVFRRGHGALYDALAEAAWTSPGCGARWPGWTYPGTPRAGCGSG